MPKRPPKKTAVKTSLRKKVDRLGEIRALIADLNEESKALKESLIENEVEDLDGKLFNVKITSYDVERVDYRGIVEEYDFPAATWKNHTSVNTQTRVTVSAR